MISVDERKIVTYILNWSNSSKSPITVPVGTVNANSTSIALIGKGSANYGELQQGNILRILENFASNIAPPNPTIGQLWYDTTSESLKVCESTAPEMWRPMSAVSVTAPSETPPPNPSIGDLWYERTGTSSGILYCFTGLGRYPESETEIGGWSQVWPRIETAAGRAEFDEIFDLVSLLIGDPNSPVFGNGAIGRLFTTLSRIYVLDADLNTKATALGFDRNTNYSGAPLKLEPSSKDWDLLLSAARWAVSRLDVPANLWAEIGSVPFVQDGRQAPAEIVELLPLYDVRFTSAERRTGQRYGSVTTTRLYTELLNVLGIVTQNHYRYELKYINASNSVNAGLDSNVVSNVHCVRSSSTWTGTLGTFSTVFRWVDDVSRNRFVFGGSAIDLDLDFTPTGVTAANTNFTAFVTQFKKIRVNGTGVRTFGSSLPMSLSSAVNSTGLRMLIQTGGTQTLATYTANSCTLTLTGVVSAGTITITANLSTPAGVVGTTVVTTSILRDRTVFSGETDLFPGPAVFVHATDSGSTTGTFTSTAGSPPVANFSATPLFGTTDPATTFVYTYTGTGSPSSIQWDLNGDGIFEQTGNSVSTTYNVPGRQTVSVKATNASGQDVLTRVGYINVSGPLVASPTPPPTPNFVFSQNPVIGEPATVTLTDTSTGATSIEWDLNGDGVYEISGQTPGSSLSQPFYPGSWVIRVRALNSSGAAVAQRVLTVNSSIPIPTANFTFSANPAYGTPAWVSLTDTSGNSPSTVQWDFTNNGSFDQTSGAGSTVVQSYAPGSYLVKMRATNSAGSSEITRSLEVAAAPPQALIDNHLPQSIYYQDSALHYVGANFSHSFVYFNAPVNPTFSATPTSITLVSGELPPGISIVGSGLTGTFTNAKTNYDDYWIAELLVTYAPGIFVTNPSTVNFLVKVAESQYSTGTPVISGLQPGTSVDAGSFVYFDVTTGRPDSFVPGRNLLLGDLLDIQDAQVSAGTSTYSFSRPVRTTDTGQTWSLQVNNNQYGLSNHSTGTITVNPIGCFPRASISTDQAQVYTLPMLSWGTSLGYFGVPIGDPFAFMPLFVEPTSASISHPPAPVVPGRTYNLSLPPGVTFTTTGLVGVPTSPGWYWAEITLTYPGGYFDNTGNPFVLVAYLHWNIY